MLLKSASEARAFGKKVAEELSCRDAFSALELLNEILSERTSFRLLDLVGAELNSAAQNEEDELLQAVAGRRSEGGWVVIASALRARLPLGVHEPLEAARRFIIQAGIWYGCDSIAERVPGQALVDYFGASLDCLADWRSDPDHWVRRAAGVAGHFWFKRANGDAGLESQAGCLLEFYSPMLSERDYEAAKGVGWALKTAGRYYPRMAADWLEREMLAKNNPPAAVIRRKALLYLPPELKRNFAKS
ncbi:MAG: hypothetical protein HPY72_10275 [Anaerolineae bacterium]|nr:hypothetical protein [Anaerolineae bacterium]